MEKIILAKNFINNEWISEDQEDCLEIYDKNENLLIAKINYISDSNLNWAIESSVEAFVNFKNTSAEERANYLLKLKEGLILEKEKFVNLIVMEAGKPIDLARIEVERGIGLLQTAFEEAIRHKGGIVPMDFSIGIGKTAFSKNFPIGPVLAITPFNFPLNLVLHKLAPALAVGCSVLLKPSLHTPLTAIALASLCKKMGLPKGVLNVVICKNEQIELLLKDDRLKMLSFTGSAEVGFKLKEKAYSKRVVLELGGNASVIVDKTADLNFAIKKIINSCYNYSGQTCLSVQKIFVDKTIYENFLEIFMEEMENIHSNLAHLEGVQNGPMISDSQINKLLDWLEEAKSKGAQILKGGFRHLEFSNILMPTLVTHANEDMKIVKEEVFGPIAVIGPVEYFDEVISLINSSKYGLQVGLFTNQISQMKYAFQQLDVGTVIINDTPSFRMDHMPYGGVKNSGCGKEGVKYAMDEMSNSRLLIYS